MTAPKTAITAEMESMLAMLRERRETPGIVTVSFSTTVGTMSATVEFDADMPGPDEAETHPERMN